MSHVLSTPPYTRTTTPLHSTPHHSDGPTDRRTDGPTDRRTDGNLRESHTTDTPNAQDGWRYAFRFERGDGVCDPMGLSATLCPHALHPIGAFPPLSHSCKTSHHPHTRSIRTAMRQSPGTVVKAFLQTHVGDDSRPNEGKRCRPLDYVQDRRIHAVVPSSRALQAIARDPPVDSP